MARKKKFLIAVMAFVVMVVGFSFKSFTPPIFTAGSIAELTELRVNDDTQYVLIRGHDRTAPVLFFVHGGPGMPAMYLAHDFQRELEKHFVVVHWDQRGAGKSYKKEQDTARLRISTLLQDMDVVVDELRRRLGTQRIWIIGHSHGSYLGALYAAQYPQKVRALIGVGQVANAKDGGRSLEIQRGFLKDALPLLDHAPGATIDAGNVEELLFEAGAEIYGATSYTPLVVSGLQSTEYSLGDILNIAAASAISSRSMKYDMSTDLVSDRSSFAVPVAIVMGEFDYVTPLELAKEFFDAIDAPAKQWIVVPGTAHFPHFEDPEAFTRILLELKKQWD